MAFLDFVRLYSMDVISNLSYWKWATEYFLFCIQQEHYAVQIFLFLVVCNMDEHISVSKQCPVEASSIFNIKFEL